VRITKQSIDEEKWAEAAPKGSDVDGQLLHTLHHFGAWYADPPCFLSVLFVSKFQKSKKRKIIYNKQNELIDAG
jgi:hypothetical protein